jgi:hypothetical protein
MKKNAILFIIAIALIATLVVFNSGNIYAQEESPWSVSATNWMQYWHYSAIHGNSNVDTLNPGPPIDVSHSKEDSVDNRLILDFNFGNFYAGGWFRVYEPLRPDTSYERLTQRYFGWTDNGITVHAGNFYQVFDRGLTLNTFYDDVIHSDNNLDGIKISGLRDRYEFDALSARALRAVPYPGGIVAYGDQRAYTIRAARGAVKPLKPVKIGFSYVRFKQNDVNTSDQAANTNLTSFNTGINYGPLDLYAEYAYKRGVDSVGDRDNGDGTYLSGSLSYKVVSVYSEYKNYYFLIYPILRPPGSPAQFSGALNTPPPVSHSGRSLAYQSGAPGERGYQIGTLISPNYNLNFEFSYSNSYARGLAKLGTPAGDSVRVKLNESYGGVRWSPFSKLTVNYHLDHFDFTDYTHGNETENYIDGYFYITPKQTISATAYTDRYHPLALASYHEDYLTLGFSQGDLFQLSIGGSLSNNINSNPNDPFGSRRKMAFAEAIIHFGSHDLTIFQGEERGGLVCSSGICTTRPAFRGTRIMLFSRF